MTTGVDQGNLWIAHALFDLGGIQFGDFTLGETAKNSPVYINPRVLFSQPILLRRVAEVIEAEVKAGQARRRPRYERFSLVAGVPFGGLQLALAFALQTDTSLVYVHPGRPGANVHAVEGRFVEGDHALVLDDLMTGGGSLLRTAEFLEEYNIEVSDAIVLIDREQGGAERLRLRGIHVTSILTLRQMMTYYHESRLIEKAQHQRVMEYLEASDRARGGEPA
ncbi:MAG TPA: phosphoribosyltransferase family protein [Chloroflexota bacterium]|nr:phosphoribosyltransferase family protein [Chloroflexota bacterium]